MTHYVLCYAHPSFDHGGLLLIEKRKPVWQSGKWNFPGGKIESGESISLAAIRELREETNVVTRSPVLKGSMFWPEAVVYVLDCPFDPFTNQFETMTDEEVRFAATSEALHYDLVQPIRLLIPMLISGLKGWRLYGVPGMDHVFSMNLEQCRV